jgi:hypothetical protein
MDLNTAHDVNESQLTLAKIKSAALKLQAFGRMINVRSPYQNQQLVKSFLNKRHAFTEQDDDEFENNVSSYAKALVGVGLPKLVQMYNENLRTSQKDWTNLQKKEIHNNWISAQSTVGLAIIKRHMPHIYNVKNYKGKSIASLWTTEVITKALRVNRKTHSTPYFSEIIRQVGFTAGTSKVTIYRPLLTKRIVQHFDAKRVLDSCIGWGGRMIGTVSNSPEHHYTGIEPFTKTFTGLQNMCRELHIEDQVTLHNYPAEVILKADNDLIPNNSYDLFITSPPYYNLEIYCEDEQTQSHQGETYEEWKTNFLSVVIQGALSKLKDTGVSCWSVKNFKTDKSYMLLDDVISIHAENGWELQTDIEFYVGNSIRPGLDKKGKEQTFVFKKRLQ